MKFTKLALGVALSLVVAAPSFAADPAESREGKVRFTGFINDVPCSIDDKSLDQTVKFGEIALHELTSNKFR